MNKLAKTKHIGLNRVIFNHTSNIIEPIKKYLSKLGKIFIVCREIDYLFLNSTTYFVKLSFVINGAIENVYNFYALLFVTLSEKMLPQIVQFNDLVL